MFNSRSVIIWFIIYQIVFTLKIGTIKQLFVAISDNFMLIQRDSESNLIFYKYSGSTDYSKGLATLYTFGDLRFYKYIKELPTAATSE